MTVRLERTAVRYIDRSETWFCNVDEDRMKLPLDTLVGFKKMSATNPLLVSAGSEHRDLGISKEILSCVNDSTLL